MTIVKPAVLFAGSGSACCPAAMARLVVNVPGGAVAMTLIVIVAVAPDVREAMDSVSTPASLTGVPQDPASADTKLTPAGNVSVSVTPVAVLGPKSVTETLYWN